MPIVLFANGLAAAANVFGQMLLILAGLIAVAGVIAIFYLTLPPTPKLPGQTTNPKTNNSKPKSMSPFDNSASLEKFAAMHRKAKEMKDREREMRARAGEISPTTAVYTLKQWMEGTGTEPPQKGPR